MKKKIVYLSKLFIHFLVSVSILQCEVPQSIMFAWKWSWVIEHQVFQCFFVRIKSLSQELPAVQYPKSVVYDSQRTNTKM